MASPVRVVLIGVLAASATCRSDPPISTLLYAVRRRRKQVSCARACDAHSSGHVRDQDTLGPTAVRLDGRARVSLGGDRMDGLAPGFSTTAGACLVHDRTLADLSTGV